jgi:hypothetical protein
LTFVDFLDNNQNHEYIWSVRGPELWTEFGMRSWRFLQSGKQRGRAHAFMDEKLLSITSLDKHSEFAEATPGFACAGARDRPPPAGNVKRGVLPVAQLGLAPGEAALEVQQLDLELNASLQELLGMRERLLSRC